MKTSSVVRAFRSTWSKQFGRSWTGNIDGIVDGAVFGWICDADLANSVVVDIELDGQLLRTGVIADVERQDVAAAGFGSGYHGFSCPLPPGHPALIRGGKFVVRRAGSGRVLLSRKVSPQRSNAASRKSMLPRILENGGAYRAKLETLTADRLRGWAFSKSEPTSVLEVDVFVDGMFFCRARADGRRPDLVKVGCSSGLGGLDVPLPLAHLGAGDHVVEFRLPDGTNYAAKLTTGEAFTRYPLNRGVGSIDLADVAVVVPIHNAADDVERCIDRLLRFTPPEVDILLVDDASPDPRIAGLMQQAHATGRIRTLHNNINQGFTGTVNRGLKEIGRKHAILLNSDCRVTPNWVQGMLAAAASRPRVATVTAMSDRAGAFSAPDIGNMNDLPAGVDEITYVRAFRERSLGLYPVVPTGNGFCMFLNRDCLDEIGLLDAEAFPRGYGEENDLCMRAGRAGWTNLVDDRTYVFHDRSKSFGAAKEALMAAGSAVVNARYPEYRKAITVFANGVDLQLARYRARQALTDCDDPRAGLPRILFVLSTQSGGTPQTNLDLMKALVDSFDPWLLRCDSRVLVLSRLVDGSLREMRRHSLAEPVGPIRHESGEYNAVVTDWLRDLAPEIVHIRHLAWHGLSLPRLARAAGASVVFSFHDFYTLCPTVNLLDERAVFCGGRCTTTLGDCGAGLWPQDSLPALKNRWVRVWRQRFSEALRNCNALVTTSESVRARILTHLPDLQAEQFHVVPHGRDFTAMHRLRRMRGPGEPVRILIPGNINRTKGLELLDALLRLDTDGRLEFHVLGNINKSAGIEHPRLIHHGSYSREEFPQWVDSIGPHVGAVFSICEETWCHTLTELWSVGIPAMVLDFPTVAGRVRSSGAGWVIPHEDPAELYQAILDITDDTAEQDRADEAVARWQAGLGRAQTTRMMAAGYMDIYRRATGLSAPVPTIAVVTPASDRLDRAFASTEIRLWERTRNALDRPVNYVRMNSAGLMAAMHDGAVQGVIIQRTALPQELVEPLLDAAWSASIPYILELDDDLLKVPPEKDPNGTYRNYAPTLRRLIEEARMLTVSTPMLGNRMAQVNPAIRVVPNRLSERLWRGAATPRRPDGKVRALYMGSKTHKDDLALILPALEDVFARYPDFRVAVIGIQNDPLPPWVERIEVPEGRGSYPRFVSWLRDQSAHFDFALAPLVDTAFNAGKSSLKALDGAGLGLRVLASHVPAYCEAKAGLKSVQLVKNESACWIEALEAEIARARETPDDLKIVERQAIRAEVLAGYGLDKTLSDFDALVLGTIAEDAALRRAG